MDLGRLEAGVGLEERKLHQNILYENLFSIRVENNKLFMGTLKP